MLDVIWESWGWTGLDPIVIVAANEFGNVIARAVDGMFWRICPEELTCEIVARGDSDYDALVQSEQFQLDWRMERLVEAAKAKLGPLSDERCYCLMRPAVLGGIYDECNFATITRRELLSFCGYLAKQIKDVPDGTKVVLRVTNVPSGSADADKRHG